MSITTLRIRVARKAFCLGLLFLGARAHGQSRLVLNELMAANQSAVVNAGEYPDWLELYNPTAQTQSLQGVSLSDDPLVPNKFVFTSGVSLPAHGFLVVWCDRSTASPGWHAGFGLSATGHGVFLYDSAANGSQLLDSVTFGLQAEDFSIGRIPDGSGAWQLNTATPATANSPRTPASPAPLLLNEWLASSSPGTSDWFEIFNPSTAPLLLSGLVFTPTPAGPTNIALPPLSFIGPQAYIQLFADKAPDLGANHLDFKLTSTGGTLAILAADRSTLIHSITYPSQVRDVSEGFLPDGNSSQIVRFPATPTPGAANYLPLRNGIVINEVLTHTDPPLEDAIEVLNTGTSPADLGGHYLSNTRTDPKRYRIPDGTIVPPGGYHVFYEYQFNPNPGLLPSFTLNSAHGDEVHLSEVDVSGNPTGYRASVTFGPSFNGVSSGRFPTSSGFDFGALDHRTFGVDTPTSLTQFRTGMGLTNVTARVCPVVINEIMFHPPTLVGTNDNVLDEFIELHNLSPLDVPLYDPNASANTWRLLTAVDFFFPTGVTLPAHGFALVVSFDPATNPTQLAVFRTRYAVPVSIAVFGPYTGKLSNRGETVELFQPDTPQAPPHPDAGFVPYVLVDRVTYGTGAPWPTAPDGNGTSLQRRDAGRYGNDVVNWASANPTAGRDNGLQTGDSPAVLTQPLSVTVALGGTATFNVTAGGTAPLAFHWYHGPDPVPNGTNQTLTVSSVTLALQGDYTVEVRNAYGSAVSQPARLTVNPGPLHIDAARLAAEQLTIEFIAAANQTYHVEGRSFDATAWNTVATLAARPLAWQATASISLGSQASGQILRVVSP